MTITPSSRLVLGSLIIPLALLAGGCAGSNQGAAPTTPSPSATQASATQTSEAPPAAIPEPTSAPTAAPQPGDRTVGPDQEITISEAGSTDVQCDGGTVRITANDAAVTVTGSCDTIEIEGSGTSLQADAVRELRIEGNNTAATLASVTEKLKVEGTGNAVTFGSGSPRIEQKSGNTTTSG